MQQQQYSRRRARFLLVSTWLLSSCPPSVHARIYVGGGGSDAISGATGGGSNNETSYESMPALFGRVMDGDKIYEGRLQFLRENPYLCDPVANLSASSFVRTQGPSIPDSHGDSISLVEPVILLASRGVCPFLKKAQVAQDIDPSVQYLIVFNFNAGGGGMDATGGGGEDTFVPMFAEYGDSRLVLLSVTHRTGQALKQYLASQPPEILQLGGPMVAFDDSPPAGLLSVDDLRDMLLSALGLFFMLISFSGCILMVAGTYGVLQPNGTGGVRVSLTNVAPEDNALGVYVSNRNGLLTPQQVQRLQERSARSAHAASEDDDAASESTMADSNCCAVCLDEFSAESDVLRLPECRHLFHADCITPWLTERQAKCPLCKHDVLEYVLRMDAKEGPNQTSSAASSSSAAASRSIWNWVSRRHQWSLVAPADPSSNGGVAIAPEEMAMDDEDDGTLNSGPTNGGTDRQSASSSSGLEMAPRRIT
jgi:Ring finger domain